LASVQSLREQFRSQEVPQEMRQHSKHSNFGENIAWKDHWRVQPVPLGYLESLGQCRGSPFLLDFDGPQRKNGCNGPEAPDLLLSELWAYLRRRLRPPFSRLMQLKPNSKANFPSTYNSQSESKFVASKDSCRTFSRSSKDEHFRVVEYEVFEVIYN
jgi:hypothetical protein